MQNLANALQDLANAFSPLGCVTFKIVWHEGVTRDCGQSQTHPNGLSSKEYRASEDERISGAFPPIWEADELGLTPCGGPADLTKLTELTELTKLTKLTERAGARCRT